MRGLSAVAVSVGVSEGGWYDSDVGRFISEDPLWGTVWDPQQLNRFAYARNNPFRFVDPTGKESFDDLMDPDGSEYSYIQETGELRYGDSVSEENLNAGRVVGGGWSSWIDPDATTVGQDPVTEIENQYREARAIDDAMEELREYLENYEPIKPGKSAGDYWAQGELNTAAITLMGTGATLFSAGVYIGVANPVAGFVVSTTGGVAIGCGYMFLGEISDYYDSNYR